MLLGTCRAAVPPAAVFQLVGRRGFPLGGAKPWRDARWFDPRAVRRQAVKGRSNPFNNAFASASDFAVVTKMMSMPRTWSTLS